MIDCPECAHSDRTGEVEYETFKMFNGVVEHVGYWVSCENCSGSGKIEEETTI